MLRLRYALLVLAGLLLAVGAGVSAVAQSPLELLVSPGQLSRAHEKQEPTCNACHESFNKGAQSSRCLECHTDINWDVRNGRGFHGKSPQAGKADCKTCHTEHKGRGAKIVQFNQTSFDHRLTDMPLSGGHVGVECGSCHKPGVKFAKAPIDCATCHRNDEPHKGRLGNNCSSCHVDGSWSAITFDHSTTSFALKGGHVGHECVSCHKDEVWKDLAATCVSCHSTDDVHRGTLGKDCASCHNERAWTVSTFNHSRTGFALSGKHANTKCESCHVKGVAAPLPRDCNSCHTDDDTHKGRNGTACAECHTTAQWSTVTFSHDKTQFPLLGKHKSTTCESCHTKPIKEWKPSSSCNDCHATDDKHKGLLGSACVDCHMEDGWASIRFEHGRDANFALNGAHSLAECESCHTQPVHVKAPAVSCVGCHRDDDSHKGQLGDGCGQCHSEKDWSREVRFDHEFSDFPLLGKHVDVDCVECHLTPAFLDAATDCVSCHIESDIHRGRFGQDCAACHNPVSWDRWRFDHDTQTDFRLTGKHKDATCESCHKAEIVQAGSLSARCVSCHASDDKHRGSFGTSCERCHNTEAFWAVELKN